MAKKKVILNKLELVEVIASTVSTIQEQTVGDLAKTMGNFAAFYNWSWDTPKAYKKVKETNNLSRTSMVLTSKEYSMWDTGEEYYILTLKLKPAEYLHKIGKIFPNEKLNMKVTSMPPTGVIGTNKVSVEQKRAIKNHDGGFRMGFQTVVDAGTFNYTVARQSWDPEKEITISWVINMNPAFWFAQSEEGKNTYNWALNATARGDKREPDPKLEEEVIEEQGMAGGMAGNTNYASGAGYSTSGSNQGKSKAVAKVNTNNWAGQIPYDWTTDIEFQMGSVSGTARVKLDIDLRMGIMAFIVQKEFIKATEYTPDGKRPYSKRAWHPSQWSFNTKLDALAFVLFIIAGFFTEGAGWLAAARYVTWAAYATVVGINTIDYLKKGDHKMAGLHLMFEALMFMKPLKWFKGGVEWMKTTKGVTWLSAKISTGIKYIGMGAKFTTVANAKPVLILLKNNPGARRMIRILAEGGEEALVKLKNQLKRAGTYKQVTVEMAEEFIKAITKNNVKLAGKITITQARKILAQSGKRTSQRLLQALISIPEMVVSSLILISLYDINMIIFPFQVYLLGLDPKKYKPIKTTPLSNLQEYLYEKIGKSDINFKLPATLTDLLGLDIDNLFGWWRVKDLITTTKMPDSAFYYNWDNVRTAYVASISSPHVKAGNCISIPKERHDFFTSNQYIPKSDEERVEWDAKQEMGTAGKYQGIRIEAKNLLGREDVNLKLKEDWLGGWRPEHMCHVAELDDILTITEEEIVENFLKTTPPPEGDDEKNDGDWKRYIQKGAEKYKVMNGGVTLKIEYSSKSYAISPYPLPETLKWFNTLPPKIKLCFQSLMSSLADWDPIQADSGKFVAWDPPSACDELGVDWEEWLTKSTIDLV